MAVKGGFKNLFNTLGRAAEEREDWGGRKRSTRTEWVRSPSRRLPWPFGGVHSPFLQKRRRWDWMPMMGICRFWGFPWKPSVFLMKCKSRLVLLNFSHILESPGEDPSFTPRFTSQTHYITIYGLEPGQQYLLKSPTWDQSTAQRRRVTAVELVGGAG